MLLVLLKIIGMHHHDSIFSCVNWVVVLSLLLRSLTTCVNEILIPFAILHH